MAHAQQSELPVVSNLTEFDFQSGTFLEKLVFNNRPLVVGFCLLVKMVPSMTATTMRRLLPRPFNSALLAW